MFGRMKWALGAALLALTVGIGAAAAGTTGGQARVQTRERARFVDRDGDGICDRLQTTQMAKKMFQKGKTLRERKGNVAMVRGFGRGKGGAANGAARSGKN